MRHTWYVTFEVQQRRGEPATPRPPRLTETFASETEAKLFAREKPDQGFVVMAGTLDPHAPRQIIASGSMSIWLGNMLDQAVQG